MEAFLPETQLVETLSENSDILVTAWKMGNKYVLVIQNLSNGPFELKWRINPPFHGNGSVPKTICILERKRLSGQKTEPLFWIFRQTVYTT